jgi:hypothetical protein
MACDAGCASILEDRFGYELLHANSVAVRAAAIGIAIITRIVDALLPYWTGCARNPTARRGRTHLEHQPTLMSGSIAKR